MKPMRLIFPLFLVLIAAFTLSNVRAADFTAGNQAELTSAINAANDEAANPGLDVITLTASFVVSLNAATPDIIVSSPIVVEGSGNTLFITSNPARKFIINPTGSLTFNDLTFNDSGGTFSNSGNLQLIQSQVLDTSELFRNEFGGVMTVLNTTFTNSTGIDGASIYNSGTLTVEGSIFTNNQASGFGGAIYNPGVAEIRYSTFTNNTAVNGGAIYNLGAVNLLHTTSTGNDATNGGAIFSDGNTVFIERSLFADNTATQSGGALNDNGEITVLASTFSGNAATLSGGAFIGDGQAGINYSTFYGNTSPLGALHTYTNGSVTISNSIVTASGAGGDCTIADSATFTPTNNLATGVCGTSAVTNLDPTLADNGGNTLTHALLAGSNAINASGACGSLDQREYTRDSQCDIGAFELAGIPPTNTPDGQITNTPSTPDTTLTATATLDPNATQTVTPGITVTATVDTTTTTTPQGTTTETTTAEPATETPGTPTETQTPTITATSDAVTFTPTPSATASPTRTPDPGTEMLLNGGFETDAENDKVPDEWKLKNPTKDKLKCDKAGKIVAFEGECAFTFKGGTGESAGLQQKVSLETFPLTSGDIITLSAQVNAPGDTTSGSISVTIVFNDPVLDQLKITLDFAPTEGYALLTQSRLLFTDNISKIKLKISHKSSGGKVFVDAVSLLNQANPNGLLPLPQ